MEMILLALVLAIMGYTVGSQKIVNEGTAVLVERFGKYHRTLEPGLNFIIPLIDIIVLEDSTRVQVLDINPQPCITRDSTPIKVDAVMYWQITNLHDAYYNVEDIELALKNLVLTTIRAEIGQMTLEDVLTARDKINSTVLKQLGSTTNDWGVKVTRVDVQNILFSPAVEKQLEQDRIDALAREDMIKNAQAERDASISKTQGIVDSVRHLAELLDQHPHGREVMQFLIAQQYVEANSKLSESENSKVLFIDPQFLTRTVASLLESPSHSSSSSPKPRQSSEEEE